MNGRNSVRAWSSTSFATQRSTIAQPSRARATATSAPLAVARNRSMGMARTVLGATTVVKASGPPKETTPWTWR